MKAPLAMVLACCVAIPVMAEDPASPETGEGTPTASPVPANDKKSRLQGTTYLGRNRQVVGATVLVCKQEDRSKLFVTSSDAKGRFHVDNLPDGAYRVEVQREGLTPVIKTDVGLRFPFRAVVEVAMRQRDASPLPETSQGTGAGAEPLILRGRIVERSGEPLAEVAVRLTRSGGEVDPRELRTSKEGRFELVDLEPGPWRLEARSVGFLPVRMDVDLREGTELSISMVRQPSNYEPSPLELMPPEQPIPPPGFDADLDSEG